MDRRAKRTAAVVALITAFGGCGNDTEKLAPLPAQTTATVGRPAQSTAPAPASNPTADEMRAEDQHREYERERKRLRDNPLPNPTRLVAGPLLFRLEGTPAPSDFDLSAQERYAVIFRLNRGPGAVRRGSSFGLFLLADNGLTPTVYRAKTNCYDATLEGKGSPTAPLARRLDRLALGTRVRVDIQPLTTTGEPQISNVYVRHPRLRRTRASLDSSNNLALVIRTPSARRALHQIGC